MIATEIISRPPSWPAYVPPAPIRRLHVPLRAFAGPFARDERWMMENAMADLRRARRHFRVVRETAGRPDLLSLFVR